MWPHSPWPTSAISSALAPDLMNPQCDGLLVLRRSVNRAATTHNTPNAAAMLVTARSRCAQSTSRWFRCWKKWMTAVTP